MRCCPMSYVVDINIEQKRLQKLTNFELQDIPYHLQMDFEFFDCVSPLSICMNYSILGANCDFQ